MEALSTSEEKAHRLLLCIRRTIYLRRHSRRLEKTQATSTILTNLPSFTTQMKSKKLMRSSSKAIALCSVVIIEPPIGAMRKKDWRSYIDRNWSFFLYSIQTTRTATSRPRTHIWMISLVSLWVISVEWDTLSKSCQEKFQAKSSVSTTMRLSATSTLLIMIRRANSQY